MVRAISNELALSIWEQAYNLRPAGKGVALLGLAVPDRTLEELRRFSIGRRDAALLELRARLFGQPINCVTSCPACNEQVELNFCVDDIRIANAGDATSDFVVASEG